MSWFPKPSSPIAAVNDLRAYLRHRSPEQRLGAVLSVLITTIIIIVFFVDSSINTAPPPQVIYVENYRPDRTDADIIASQKKDEAERLAAMKEQQRQYQKLENQLGM
ncbi:MAG: hypothetical protein ABIO29_03530 [Sphingomicrobium sp.]